MRFAAPAAVPEPLGAPVQFKHLLGAKPVDPRLLEPWRARRGHVEGHLEGGNINGQTDRSGQTPEDGGEIAASAR
jgi:hypothetical protein